MAEWLYEHGIGETRAALIDGDRIVQARIELADAAHRLGEVIIGKLTDRTIVMLDDGVEVLLDRPPPGLTQGQRMKVEITREAIPEPGRSKRAKAALTEGTTMPGPSLRARLEGPVREQRAHEADALEAAGWSEVLDEALTGEIAFPGGALRMTPTPAMTLFDVDGDGPLEMLAERAAVAVARAVVRLDVGGSIGVDFPTLAGKAPRQSVAAAIDAHLPMPFERTGMNGFGFLQIVRPRLRVSLPELLRADPVGAAARAALRTIERTPPTAPNTYRLPSAVRARIEQHSDWLAELVRRTGRIPTLST